MTNKDKILLAQASSAYSHSLKEVFANPGIAAQIKVGLTPTIRPQLRLSSQPSDILQNVFSKQPTAEAKKIFHLDVLLLHNQFVLGIGKQASACIAADRRLKP